MADLRNRSRQPSAQNPSIPATANPPSWAKQSPCPTVNLRSLFCSLLAFRIVNALLTRTFFQPDEHYQTTEIAHRIVFGYGFTSWEWSSSHDSAGDAPYLSAAVSNLLNGPVRSILHPLLFVPGYALLKWTALDSTYALILFPRLQQALVAAIGDFFTFRLAHRIGGPKVAWLATLVGLSNLYSLFTATRTFSNTTEAAITAAALFYWPFVPFFSGRFDVASFSTAQERAKLRELQGPGCVWQQSAPRYEQTEYGRDLDQKQGARLIYDRSLRKSVLLAACACLLRPTNGVLWVYLAVELLVRQLQCIRPKSNSASASSRTKGDAEAESGSVLPLLEIAGEAGSLVSTLAIVGFGAVAAALCIDTMYDYFANQAPRGGKAVLPALSLVSFLHKNVVANLSIFYGANPWHWYVTQGLPVLCTVWLPATLVGMVEALKRRHAPAGRQQGVGGDAQRSLARLVCVTVGVYSLLGHKEFRFLQPLLPALSVLAATGLADSYATNSSLTLPGSPPRQLWRAVNVLPLWLRAILLTLQPIAAVYLTSIHAVGQEQVAWELGRIYREQQLLPVPLEPVEFGTDFGRIHSLGFLMPCHSTPWATHLHDERLVERSWFIECPPPPARSAMTRAQKAAEYWDQSDFFYNDPIRYLVDRLPYNVDTDYPASPPPSGMVGEGEGSNPWDMGWRHAWPSHLVVFESLLKEGTRKVGHTRTLKNLLSLKGYREVARFWNTPKHEDARRDGDIVVLEYKGPKSHR